MKTTVKAETGWSEEASDLKQDALSILKAAYAVHYAIATSDHSSIATQWGADDPHIYDHSNALVRSLIKTAFPEYPTAWIENYVLDTNEIPTATRLSELWAMEDDFDRAYWYQQETKKLEPRY